jgi:hypothetical protein
MKKRLFSRTNIMRIARAIVCVCSIVIAISFNSCRKCTTYYACCSKDGWNGPNHQTCNGDHADSTPKDAARDAQEHNQLLHDSISYATVCEE